MKPRPVIEASFWLGNRNRSDHEAYASVAVAGQEAYSVDQRNKMRFGIETTQQLSMGPPATRETERPFVSARRFFGPVKSWARFFEFASPPKRQRAVAY
jgi:hypothetical protein